MESTMTTTPVPIYRAWDIYLESPPAVRVTVDALQAAVAAQTSPLYGLDRITATGEIGFSFTWHDGAKYRVTLTKDGELLRLFRLQYTGLMIPDEDGPIPDVTWRTVRAFTKDRAGKVLAPAMGIHPAAKSWTEAAAR